MELSQGKITRIKRLLRVLEEKYGVTLDKLAEKLEDTPNPSKGRELSQREIKKLLPTIEKEQAEWRRKRELPGYALRPDRV